LHLEPQGFETCEGQHLDVSSPAFSGVSINKTNNVIIVPIHRNTLGKTDFFFAFSFVSDEAQQLFPFLKYA